YRFVSYRDVMQQGAAALNGYRALILPRTLALSDREAAAIRDWVGRGGTLIADYLPGAFDEHCKGRATGALDEVFGVQRDAAQGVTMTPRVRVLSGGKKVPLAERLFWTRGGRHYLCIVMNPLRQANVDNAGSVSGALSLDPIPISIDFRDGVKALKNERTG